METVKAIKYVGGLQFQHSSQNTPATAAFLYIIHHGLLQQCDYFIRD